MSSTLKLTLWFTGLVVAIFLGTALFFYYNPVGVGVWLARRALTQADFDKQQVEGPRGTLTYWEGGAGARTVVLIHGMGNQAGTWVKVAPPLAAQYRVVIVDLPGHGDSDPRGGILSLRDEVEGLGAVLDTAVPEGAFTLVGNSLGGWVAMLYCLEAPERAARVEQLVLVGSAGLTGEVPEGVKLVPETREEARRLLAVMSPPDTPPTAGFVLDDLIEKIAEGPSPRLLESFDARFFVDDRLASIETPADLVWGSADRLVPPSVGERLAAGLPHARLHTLAQCGHLPQQQCPAAFLKLLRQVLASPAAAEGFP
jgi:pimeloyl-ACP methyl ester carboxylesterase